MTVDLDKIKTLLEDGKTGFDAVVERRKNLAILLFGDDVDLAAVEQRSYDLEAEEMFNVES